MQRTRKWTHVGPEAKRLAALGWSSPAIAAQLGVNRSTVHRWMETGQLADTRTTRASDAPVPPAAEIPVTWAAAIRAAYPLDTTDAKLVDLADLALSVAQNPEEQSSVRLAAAARFQSVVKQLAPRLRQAAEEQPAAPRPVTIRTDPRAILIQ